MNFDLGSTSTRFAAQKPTRKNFGSIGMLLRFNIFIFVSGGLF
jgi:hypothetical protein